MSRVGKKPIQIPEDVTVTIKDANFVVKGPKGTLSLQLHPHITIAQDGSVLNIMVQDPDLVDDRALWGLFGSLVRNMISGVVSGFEKSLEINGVGFKAAVKGKNLELSLGFSHVVVFPIPEGIIIAVEKEIIKVNGIDKALVGQTAARIRGLKKPEPYKGKGIRYTDEIIRRKAGKAAGKASA
ncbi:MAG: 50S ribosomal protein L6 [Candidatus Magasanikbacteria bacterium GW2011_GWA2_45_39]|uniref:Large ribosomal subunit protein uL6 n=2 Tax=Candidatus Magasanikiibacteriota TaxID=1752731 RepID=A0A0G1MY14_9BACT|nr:MAG: 50S ribosomal protein L6 [Candidatus Magasanikbacteria bacterium GW2011_GWA2_45_39]KKU13261.1 MAG: 50S ribosomal protein L6 [Candidatus Magasanikbacteria bacterium GW2011_GWC2_45_8]HBW73669.1 50S ribosomal protein L6 [Candidatus Magasanikbacteria bacterium]